MQRLACASRGRMVEGDDQGPSLPHVYALSLTTFVAAGEQESRPFWGIPVTTLDSAHLLHLLR